MISPVCLCVPCGEASSRAAEPNPSVRTHVRFTIARTQQTHHTAQAFPCGLIQRRLSADNIANHVPRRHVQRSFRRHSHRQRHSTLRTKTNPLRRRLLPRFYPHRLRKHIHCHRLVPSLNLPPAPQTRNKLHFPPVPSFQTATRECRPTLPSKHFPRADALPASMQKGSARRHPPQCIGVRRNRQNRRLLSQHPADCPPQPDSILSTTAI